MRLFDKFFVTLRLQYALLRAYGRHSEDERQTLSYLILKIWTIFNSTQIASNGAHVEVYILVLATVIYAKSVSFLLVTRRWQSRAAA